MIRRKKKASDMIAVKVGAAIIMVPIVAAGLVLSVPYLAVRKLIKYRNRAKLKKQYKQNFFIDEI